MPHRIPPQTTVRLADLPTRAGSFHDDRPQAEEEFKQLREELMELQNVLYAQGTDRLLIVLQAMDAGGKDSTIRKVFRGVNPQGVRVTSFKAPSEEERAHDFLWRIHQAVPARGMIGVFNRSHYEDVLVARVDNLVAEETWRARYQQINEFEQLLTSSGTRILKFYLHISLDEQKERFQERLDRPEKNWKFSFGDLAKRKDWDKYMAAFEDVFLHCSPQDAPWYIIPADQKWYRNLAISRVIVGAIREMDPQYPQAEEGLGEITID
jgi:PPK2 family polyphosphate:nucleotide phosphotransferase